MPAHIHHEFIGVEKNLVFYANKPIINRVHTFYDYNNEIFVFNSANESYIKIYDERDNDGYLILTLDLTIDGDAGQIILNASSSQTNIPLGKYYYEFIYVDTGGYEITLAYGEAKFI